MQYSPKLKKAMQEIRDILSREDIAGFVVIHEPGFSEYLLKIDPTYSTAKIRDGKIELKAKLEHFENSIERNRKVADTINMFHCINRCMGQTMIPLLDLEEDLNKKFNPNHFGGSHTDNSTQNN
ncbi:MULTISPECIES: hypothetical protein [unclassified Sphingobacterium]|uniref:hypothetical protein n=1 Tax=unclassified Sphingobacterium TaxID=2609468 RepID=UPI0025F326E0|nr:MULTISPECIES: hypothetical protein [unclassified Sphingobacterium]